jgi:hypothetical protein
MITLEEQVRRYAADVAGPVRGPAPPLRDGDRGPTPSSRLVLVAVLVVFVAGFAWLVVRASGTTHEEMVPAEPEVPAVPAPTSWAGEMGRCTDTIEGIPLHGPDGEGLCLGIDRQGTKVGVGFVHDGTTQAASSLTGCEVMPTGTFSGIGGDNESGAERVPMWITTAGDVERIDLTLDSDRRVVAITVRLPDAPGVAFAGFWLEPGEVLRTPPVFMRSTGAPFVPGDVEPPLLGCTPQPQVPTPSDSEEWEDQVLDHRGEVRGRTAGLVELHDGVSAYRVVDDRGELVGYTMVDGGVGFVDRALAEDAATLRQLVTCGDEYVATLTATPECTNALATIGIDTTPPPPTP